MNNSSLPKKITYGQKYGPAMKITSQEEADTYFEKLVRHSMSSFEKTREEAEALERTNLGYWAGYYDHETRLRVEELFRCKHPVFGSAADGRPTPEEAFEAGIQMAEKGAQQEREVGGEESH